MQSFLKLLGIHGIEFSWNIISGERQADIHSTDISRHLVLKSHVEMNELLGIYVTASLLFHSGF